MNDRCISKQALASPGRIIMLGLWVPPPVIARTSFGRGMSWLGDMLLGLRHLYWSYYGGVIWVSQMLRHGESSRFLDQKEEGKRTEDPRLCVTVSH
ncbi:hypothetical protein AVEN_207333-1 [Araneus ventricosus]|uniref:Uncharacterized protein n=1 Tax=Araneus ventricosus TaxID=182803 RepID=A0A4Y2KER5_ARAVE|nr:hypothetical protein AVEN_207333-1 [Araneus ventricosus]